MHCMAFNAAALEMHAAHCELAATRYLDDKDHTLVLATDGVWDVMENDEGRSGDPNSTPPTISLSHQSHISPPLLAPPLLTLLSRGLLSHGLPSDPSPLTCTCLLLVAASQSANAGPPSVTCMEIVDTCARRWDAQMPNRRDDITTVVVDLTHPDLLLPAAES